MKKMIFALVTMLTLSLSARAMSYEQARNEALFLTDKMAYELNLTDAQYEAAFEINLDYLMSVATVDDVFGVYWERRNLELYSILLAVGCLPCRFLLLPSSLLGGWPLALRHLYPLSASRLLLLWPSPLLCYLSRRTQLALERRTQLLPRTRQSLPSFTSTRPSARRYAQQL